MEIWTELLSRDNARIRRAFLSLGREERLSVRTHLILMTSEDGWHPAQSTSAQIALDAIKDIP